MGFFGKVGKGVASLFGGRARRREEDAAEEGFEAARDNLENFEFTNAFDDYDPVELGDANTYEGSIAEVGQLGPAAQAEMGKLSSAQGYQAAQGKAQGYQGEGYQGQGYTSQGYSAMGTNVSNLQRGADTGLTNNMNNLQVSTAEADMQNQEVDQALAATQDAATQAGTGAGGATAIAAAAAKSKQGIAAKIGQQEQANNMARASAEQRLQENQLAQGNTASQFDLGQQQVNVGAQNDASQFAASAQNQAAQFGASAQNQANQFSAGARNTANQFSAQAKNTMSMANMQAQNQARQFGASSNNAFAQARFGAQNQMNQYNTSAQNSFAQTQFGAGNQFALANQQSMNQSGQFNAGSQNQFDMANQQQLNNYYQNAATAGNDIQESQYNQNMDQFNITGDRLGAATAARNSATNDLIGGISAVAGRSNRVSNFLRGNKG
jgi:hypothetical protein